MQPRAAAVEDAKRLTQALARSVIVPNLTDALADGDPRAIRRLDEVVAGKVTGVTLTVADDGIGFDVAGLATAPAVGRPCR